MFGLLKPFDTAFNPRILECSLVESFRSHLINFDFTQFFFNEMSWVNQDRKCRGYERSFRVYFCLDGTGIVQIMVFEGL